MTGSWQTTISCSEFSTNYATATSFLQIDRDPASGELLASLPECGTVAFPGTIERIASCSPGPTPLVLDGATVASPPTGFAASDARTERPFAFPLLGCSEVVRILSNTRTDGTVIEAESGRATRIVACSTSRARRAARAR